MPDGIGGNLEIFGDFLNILAVNGQNGDLSLSELQFAARVLWLRGCAAIRRLSARPAVNNRGSAPRIARHQDSAQLSVASAQLFALGWGQLVVWYDAGDSCYRFLDLRSLVPLPYVFRILAVRDVPRFPYLLALA